MANNALVRPELALLGSGDVPYGTCRDVTGVFRGRAATPVPKVRLLGCRAEAPLMTALDAIGQPTMAGRRRRRIRAEIHAIAADGSAYSVMGTVVSGTVEASEPSQRVPNSST